MELLSKKRRRTPVPFPATGFWHPFCAMAGVNGAFGIHDKAFRVGRGELLSWLNDLLQIKYEKVEQCWNGGAYCQIMDATYGDIPMHRVLFNARLEHEATKNYKILQEVFQSKKIQKAIDYPRLLQGKPLDNLEFLQWCKRFHELNASHDVPYDAAARRTTPAPSRVRTTPDRSEERARLRKERQLQSASPRIVVQSAAKVRAQSARRASPAGVWADADAGAGGGVARAEKQCAGKASEPLAGRRRTDQFEWRELERRAERADAALRKVDELQLTVDMLERERDFYFKKLRQIEVLWLQVQNRREQMHTVVEKTLGILYAVQKPDDLLSPAEDPEELEDEAVGQAASAIEAHLDLDF